MSAILYDYLLPLMGHDAATYWGYAAGHQACLTAFRTKKTPTDPVGVFFFLTVQIAGGRVGV